MSENKIVNWIPVIELAVLAFTTLGTTITLYLHTDAKMERSLASNQSETRAVLDAIREEIKDFHGRLCAIEERNRSKN